jgi:hypothetical protein
MIDEWFVPSTTAWKQKSPEDSGALLSVDTYDQITIPMQYHPRKKSPKVNLYV